MANLPVAYVSEFVERRRVLGRAAAEAELDALIARSKTIERMTDAGDFAGQRQACAGGVDGFAARHIMAGGVRGGRATRCDERECGDEDEICAISHDDAPFVVRSGFRRPMEQVWETRSVID